jgi:hypothetical protein
MDHIMVDKTSGRLLTLCERGLTARNVACGRDRPYRRCLFVIVYFAYFAAEAFAGHRARTHTLPAHLLLSEGNE